MKIATSWSTVRDTEKAVRSAFDDLIDSLDNSPSLLIMYSSVEYPVEQVQKTIQKLAPDVPIHGGSTCLGVMTSDGFHQEDGTGLGMFGIYDPDGDYGVGMVDMNNDARAAGAAAVKISIENAGRIGESPDLIWLNSAPGNEEDVILGIQDVIGDRIPIIGGSTADNTVEGHWYQFTNHSVGTNAVITTAMYPSVETYMAFHSGYSPTQYKGVVTRAGHRTIYEINGIPAAQLYNSWTGGTISEYLSGGNILSATSFFPIGRVVGKVGKLPYYRLSHPDTVTEDGGLTLFTEIEAGQEVTLLKGSEESLVKRAGRVVKAALDVGELSPENVDGAIVVYCAGCMLAIQDKMPEVSTEITEVLGSNPFLGIFTFGEQGCFIRGENRHGNLMISTVVFEKG